MNITFYLTYCFMNLSFSWFLKNVLLLWSMTKAERKHLYLMLMWSYHIFVTQIDVMLSYFLLFTCRQKSVANQLIFPIYVERKIVPKHILEFYRKTNLTDIFKNRLFVILFITRLCMFLLWFAIFHFFYISQFRLTSLRGWIIDLLLKELHFKWCKILYAMCGFCSGVCFETANQ